MGGVRALRLAPAPLPWGVTTEEIRPFGEPDAVRYRQIVMERRVVCGLLVASLTFAGCSSSEPPEATGTSPLSVETDDGPTATVGRAENSVASTPSSRPDSKTVDAPTTAPVVAGEESIISTTPGTEIGRASTGPPIGRPIPWDTGTIYLDPATPEFIELGFVPADPNCIAAEVTATIGRGGAVLLSLFVDGTHVTGDPCAGESGTSRLSLTLNEALAGRRIYTDTSVYYGNETAAAERLSDEVVGLDVDAAIAVIEEAGLRSEVMTPEPGERDSIFVPDRINLYLAGDGTVEFATPG